MWLSISIIAYFINAGVFVSDKFFLSKKIHSSIAYAFFVGIWSIFNVVLLFLDPWVPMGRDLAFDLLAGFLYLVTLVFFYKALHQSEATKVIPIVGALTPVFSLIFSYLFLGDSLGEAQLLAFVILICGGVLLSVKHTRFYGTKEFWKSVRHKFGNIIGGIHAAYRPSSRLILNSVTSAILFALYFVLIKHIYNSQPFVGAFVWSRIGGFVGVLLMLLVPDWRRIINSQREHSKRIKNVALFIGVRLLASAAFIMLNYAISLGNVALVNALQGVQYFFLFFIVLVLSATFPKILKEELGGGVITYKIIGIVLVFTGLYMIAML